MALRVGVVGLGGMGANHARVYHEMKNVDLVGVCDVNEDLCKDIAKKYHTTPHAKYADLFSQDLDAVNIVVPTALHREVADAAFAKGLDVLLEKPISESVEAGIAITLAAQKAGVKLQIGHIERFNPAVRELKRRIFEGEMGDIVSMTSKRVGPHNPRIRDVGVIVDLAVHDIDIMADLLGKQVTTVYASAGQVIHPHEDYALIHLAFDNGASGVIDTNWLTPYKVRELTVVGTKGFAVVDYAQARLVFHDGSARTTYQEPGQEPLAKELEYFIDCVANDNQPEITGEVGVAALRAALAAEESARSHRVVSLE